MIALIITVLLSDGTLKKVAIPGYENTSPMQCMMAAPVEVAKFMESHPNYVLKKWECRVVGQEASI